MQKSMTKFFRNFEGTRFLAVLLSMRREKGMIYSKLIVEDKNGVVLKNNLRATLNILLEERRMVSKRGYWYLLRL